MVAALAMYGSDKPKLSIEGVVALRMVSRADKGCNAIAEFGGFNDCDEVGTWSRSHPFKNSCSMASQSGRGQSQSYL